MPQADVMGDIFKFVPQSIEIQKVEDSESGSYSNPISKIDAVSEIFSHNDIVHFARYDVSI